MRLLTTVIYTDKLDQVRAFYEQYFHQLTADGSDAHAYNLKPFAEAHISWVDASWARQPVTIGAVLRISLPYTLIEHAALVEKGLDCGQLIVEQWGAASGGQVQYFVVTDPSGSKILFYEDHFGEDKQLMTTGDGTGTREVQKGQKAAHES
jgi:predicted enzyme related to lactoylglutathione lyase